MAEHFTICPKCHRVLSNPVQLDCFHVFCGNCVHTLEKIDGSVRCNVCKSQTDFPLTKPDKFVSSFIEVLSKSRSMRDTCYMYGEMSRAPGCIKQSAYHCLECEQSFCHKCVSSHCEGKNHDEKGVVLFADALELAFQKRKQVEEMCADHQVPVTQFCMQCHQLACITCGIVDHKGHWVVSTEVALKHLTSDIQKCSRNVSGFHKATHLPRKSTLLYLREEKQRCETEINEIFEEVNKLIESMKCHYKQKLEKSHSSLLEILKNEEQYASSLCLSAHQACAKLHLVNKYGTDVEMLAAYKHLNQSPLMRAIENEKIISLPKFILSDRDELLRRLQSTFEALNIKTIQVKGDFTQQILRKFENSEIESKLNCEYL
ncbi:hypothetical protein FSP39_021630 [Pinctada imbricata]|uniref:Uncharacterized protein n=1 Tax=Pinctada imbricata TaxID=66713 RepID=A0AA89BZ71_PINIB|nr:hypothetical protein FSP39_021630 [Pinctada imbricata]